MTDAAIPLLETKLHSPRPSRGIVSRPRLRERLERREQPALTLVSAPAGFGKTTLVAEWFADGPPTAWLSLDRSDNDPARFWAYVVAALQTAEPGAGDTARSLLQAPQPSMDAVVAVLLNDLHAIAHDLVLVLDDYHVIESTEIHQAVAFLLEHLPPLIHLVLATRGDPALPLAGLRASGKLLEIRATELRFTAEEAAEYLNGAMGLALTDTDIATLEARTEGWIAALQLAALSMQGREDIAGFVDGFAGDDRFIIDYLVGEVLELQSDEIRSFLLETSILDRLTGGLCDALTGRTGGKATLEYLDRANLFLVPLDDRRSWYRYHHLFADVLRARLLDEHPERLPEIHRRASDWHDANGDQSEAIAHAMAGGAFDRAAQLIELTVPTMSQTRQEATLRGWLEALPAGLFDDRPVLSIALVGARMATGDSAGVEPLLQIVESWLEASAATRQPPNGSREPIVFNKDEYTRLPAQVAVYRAGLALLAGDVAGCTMHAHRVLELVEPSDHLRTGSAAAFLGLAHWTLGDLDEARRRYSDAIGSFVLAGYLPDVLGCSVALADIQITQGRLHDAAETFESGLRHTAQLPGLRGAADMHAGMSEVLLERNDLDAAARHLEAVRELGEHAGLPQHAYRWRVTTARLRQAQGDLIGALELLEEAEPVYNTDFSPPVRPIAALKARVHLAQGDVPAAIRWANGRGLAADDELSYVLEFEHITFARTLLARHAADHNTDSIGDAIGLLGRLRTAAEEGHRTGSAIEILVLLALAHHADHASPAATGALEEALALAEPEGHVRVFLDEGPTMTELLRSTTSRGAVNEHARKVLAATRPPDVVAAPRAGLIDELSSRELEVLRILRSDLSGPDIARELLVSLNTLRTHTKNIYAKLGVNNRREAIRRAAELGL